MQCNVNNPLEDAEQPKKSKAKKFAPKPEIIPDIVLELVQEEKSVDDNLNLGLGDKKPITSFVN